MVGVGTDLDLEAVLVPVLVPVLVALGLELGLAATAAGPVRCRGDDEPTSHALTNRPCRSIETALPATPTSHNSNCFLNDT